MFVTACDVSRWTRLRVRCVPCEGSAETAVPGQTTTKALAA